MLVVLLTRTVIRGQDSAIANQGSMARNVKSMTNYLIIISRFLHSVEITVYYSQVSHIWTMEVVFTIDVKKFFYIFYYFYKKHVF